MSRRNRRNNLVVYFSLKGVTVKEQKERTL